jgi:erythromycin esterase-like protein
MTIRPSIQDAGWAFTSEHGAGVGVALTNFLQSLETTPRLLGFGEAMHGEEALPRLRNQMFQHLVEHEGYRSIALESSSLAGLTVDTFVAGGAGSLDDVMRHGFSHGSGESEANRELVSWMREYNRDRPHADRLRFFGFDAPTEMVGADSPRRALAALHRYLAPHVDPHLLPCAADTIDHLIGDDERWTNPAAAMDPSQSVGSSNDARELRFIADDLLTLLMAESPRLVSATSRDDWWQASLYGRSAAGLLRYHAGMADTSPGRMGRLLGVRETMMVDNLLAIMENQARQGPTFVFAHNGHLRKGQTHMQLREHSLRWWTAGAIVDTHLGDQYAFIASALGAAPHQGINAPQADTPEGLLSSLPENQYLIAAGPLASALASTGDKLRKRTDTSSNYTYFALEPGRVDETDAVVFIKHVAPGSAPGSGATAGAGPGSGASGTD